MAKPSASKPTSKSTAVATTPSVPPLKFTGHRYFVNRLILSTLTGRPVQISQIRPNSPTRPGLSSAEVSLLRLLDAITNGSEITFNDTGTAVLYKPGMIIGSVPGYGADAISGEVRHVVSKECASERAASYFLIPLLVLGAISRSPMRVRLTGPGVVTAATERDVSVDCVRTAVAPYLEKFGVRLERVEIKTEKRSCTGGGGEVLLVIEGQVKVPRTVHALRSGVVKQIRGVAYAVGVGGGINARMIDEARGLMNKVAPDTRIFSDNAAAPLVDDEENGGKKRTGVGFGLCLVATTTEGAIYSSDVAAPANGGITPEDIGRRAALQLLEAIAAGGAVGSQAVMPVIALMSMGSEDVGRVVLGRDIIGSEDVLQLARDAKAFGMSSWGIREASGENDHDGEVVVSIVGKGLGNLGRKVA
jgi:RNA 3'-terminal phosphate cyclase-like protein